MIKSALDEDGGRGTKHDSVLLRAARQTPCLHLSSLDCGLFASLLNKRTGPVSSSQPLDPEPVISHHREGKRVFFSQKFCKWAADSYLYRIAVSSYRPFATRKGDYSDRSISLACLGGVLCLISPIAWPQSLVNTKSTYARSAWCMRLGPSLAPWLKVKYRNPFSLATNDWFSWHCLHLSRKYLFLVLLFLSGAQKNPYVWSSLFCME